MLGTPALSSNRTEIDASVTESLKQLSDARRLGDWMFAQFSQFIGGSGVEIGAGIGTFRERILGNGVSELLLIEPEEACAQVLDERFVDDERVTVVREELPDAPSLSSVSNRYDFVLCQNVLEHIKDHQLALEAMASALRPGGHLSLLVPAHPRLFGHLDRSFGHYRRYTRTLLIDLFAKTELKVLNTYSFNALGILGWIIKCRLAADSLGSNSLRIYEKILPLWRPIEDRINIPFGLSYIVHAVKPQERGVGT